MATRTRANREHILLFWPALIDTNSQADQSRTGHSFSPRRDRRQLAHPSFSASIYCQWGGLTDHHPWKSFNSDDICSFQLQIFNHLLGSRSDSLSRCSSSVQNDLYCRLLSSAKCSPFHQNGFFDPSLAQSDRPSLIRSLALSKWTSQ
jgi:hypothetical protein